MWEHIIWILTKIHNGFRIHNFFLNFSIFSQIPLLGFSIIECLLYCTGTSDLAHTATAKSFNKYISPILLLIIANLNPEKKLHFCNKLNKVELVYTCSTFNRNIKIATYHKKKHRTEERFNWKGDNVGQYLVPNWEHFYSWHQEIYMSNHRSTKNQHVLIYHLYQLFKLKWHFVIGGWSIIYANNLVLLELIHNP